MEDKTILDKMMKQRTVAILLVRGENPDGSEIFAYVAVRADRIEEFMAAQGSGTFYPEDYGVIIEAGEGTPSPEVRQKMKEEYGFEEERMVDIPNEENVNEILDEFIHLDEEEDDL